jgi:hypothetical protein
MVAGRSACVRPAAVHGARTTAGARALGVLAALWLGASACSHPAPPAAVAPSPVRHALLRPVHPRNAPLQLPPELLLAGRWRQPDLALREIASWSPGESGLERWLRERIGNPSRPIDLAAPIEFMSVLDGKGARPELHWVLSLGLQPNASNAQSTLPRWSAPRDVPSPLGWACAEAPALGPAALRMVCSPSEAELAALLPLATRALPLAPLGANEFSIGLHTQMLHAVDDAKLSGWVSGWLRAELDASAVNDRFDASLAQLAVEGAHELRAMADELDGATLGLALSPDRHALDLSLAAPAATGRSLLGQSLFGSGTVGLAPADFWRAQLASEKAGYLWAFESSPFARWRAPLGALVGELLEFRGLPRRLRRQARELVETIPLPRGPLVYAAGRLPESSSASSAEAAWLPRAGWNVYDFAGNFAEYEGYAEALVSAVDDPVLGAQIARLWRAALGSKWAPRRLRRRHPAVHGLPRESFVLEIGFGLSRSEQLERDAETPAPAHANGEHSSDRAKSGPTLLVLCVPEPGGVRAAWGNDEKFLASLVLDPGRGQESNTLAGRAGLGSLNQYRTLAAGFSSLAALSHGDGAAASAGAADLPSRAIAGAPHRGESPIVYRVAQQASAGQGGPPVLLVDASVGRDTIEDLLFLIARAASPLAPAPAD